MKVTATSMRIEFYFISLLLSSLLCSGDQTNNVNKLCNSKCQSKSTLDCSSLNFTENGRCCIQNSNPNELMTVIGIDLIGCGLTNITEMFHNMGNLEQLFLQNNKIEMLQVEDFIGVTKLKKLTLPPNLTCPGGEESWKFVEISDNVTTCIDELSTCEYFHVSCPNSNSYCHDVGPRLTECLCLPGYHGYKCLRKGTFPTVTFFIGLGLSTVVVSTVLWVTQRRRIKKNL